MEGGFGVEEGFEFDVIVVGAGIMGSCTAYQLAKRGHKVLLLEQFDLLHQRGSSHGESRTIRLTYPEPFYPSMVLESWRLWEEAEQEVGFRVLTPTSHLDIGLADERSLRAVIETSSCTGIEHRVVTRDDVAGRFGGLIELPEGWVGVCSDGGVIRATKAVSMFHMLALRHGAQIRDRVEVTAVEAGGGSGGGVRVGLGDGKWISGRKCVLTAGAWLKKLVNTVIRNNKNALTINMPLQPLHTTICYWKIRGGLESQFSTESDFPTFASYGNPYIYGTPSLEFPGLLKVALHGGYPCDPDRRTWASRPEAVVGNLAPWIHRVLGDRVDSGGPVVTQSCMYTMTPDGDFVIDFLGGEFGEDVVVAGGFSGHGFKMGPVVGRIVADLVTTGEASGVELKHFLLSRFEDNPEGNAKDYGDQVTSKDIFLEA